MSKFNHAFDFAFEIKTDKPAELRAALLERANSLTDAELIEACGCFDTMDGDA